MKEQIEARIVELKTEWQKADEELSKLRPRAQYLESMLYRLDGALSAMQSLLDTPAAVNGAQPMAQPALP